MLLAALGTLVAGRLDADDQRILHSIAFVGNRTFSTSEIRSWMIVKEGGAFTQAELERIVAQYVDYGYVHARIDSFAIVQLHDSSEIDVTVWIAEGKRSVVSSVQFRGMRAMAETDLTGAMVTRAGAPFSPTTLEEDIKAILQVYERNGFPFAKIVTDEIAFEEREKEVAAFITLDIVEGDLVKLGGVRVEGNTSTKSDVITREARIAEGETFRGDQPAKIKRNLERMQLFSSVSLPELFVNADGTSGLLVRVVEGNPNRFDGVIGYVPGVTTGEKGYVTGLLSVEFRNLLGTARRLSARWYRENRSTQEVELGYREPWVAGFPVNAEAGFYQRKQDSTYILRRYTIAADAAVSDDWTFGLSFSQSDVFPAEGYGTRVTSESRTRNFGFLISYDSRNDPVTPTTGFRYRTEYHTGVKEITRAAATVTQSRSTTQRLSFDFEHFLGTFDRQVLSTAVHGCDFRSGSLESSDLYRLGGANTLRGYREAQFLGSRLAWANLEYRLLVARRSFVFGFVDVGYIFTPDRREAGLLTNEQTKAGYGVGLRIDSPLGLMGVSIAFGQGDTFSTAKLHLRLMNEF